MAAAIVLLAVGVVALVYAITGLFTSKRGWQRIEAPSSAETNCAGDFVLLYDLGSSGVSVSAEKRGVTEAYSDAAVAAYRLFESRSAFEGVHNLWYINHHPNETVDVDPALYRALEQVQDAGDRTLYLGPVYEIYNGLFSCDSDAQTADYDPLQNEALREYFARCAAFGGDPASVDVQLLGEGEIRLAVSEEYLAFAREQEIESFLDFGWMKNAFLADCLADALADAGYTRFALSSFDGFVRNLCQGDSFGLALYERGVQIGSMAYTAPMSVVCLKSYPLEPLDRLHYYRLADGTMRTAYLDPADGLCRSALDDLTVCSREGGCAETALALAPLYVAEEMDTQALSALSAEGIFFVRCGDGEAVCNDPDVTFDMAEGYTSRYGED